MIAMLKTFLRRLVAPRQARLLAPGSPAPPFDVVDHLGRRQRLSDYRGRRLVLWFYPQADTPG